MGTNTSVLVFQEMTEIRLRHYPTTDELRPYVVELSCSYLDMAVFQMARMSRQNIRIFMDFLDPVYVHRISVRLRGLSPAYQ